MKTLITALTLSTLIAGAGVANAQPQGSEEAADYALSQRMATPSAYASVRGAAREPVWHTQTNGSGNDFQLQGR